ncbi:aspartate/glutamate racemase family protein [Fusibacter ferrireducens]|uniref:Aspartate/glutamate racemase family protein n=1 Tax=Fusibacter ferrireducens TaxID=2785058 RepID=A0ABR9ZZU0_9FIRM|nr:aspartate/glutamate racemase family protein [Fusibacter ferrireducens]MBF4695968.1 aspartate/glutamate racemase family protein [Fusibacter ferrireducens]
MKTIGLLGGMSWESSLEYYRIINEEVKLKLGGSHSAKCVMFSFDFHDVETLQHNGDWESLTKEMVTQAQNLKNAGAEFIVICTNTMHLMAPNIEQETGLKVLHIADVTGKSIKLKNLKKVALLGTKFTMEGDFYKAVLKDKHDIDVIIPNESDRQIVHDIIYNELVVGIINPESKLQYAKIIEKLASDGAEGVILGCTEIPLLIQQQDVSIPVFDTTEIHSKAAVSFALEA